MTHGQSAKRPKALLVFLSGLTFVATFLVQQVPVSAQGFTRALDDCGFVCEEPRYGRETNEPRRDSESGDASNGSALDPYDAPDLRPTTTGLLANGSVSGKAIGANLNDGCFPRNPGKVFYNGAYNSGRRGAVLPATSTSAIYVHVADVKTYSNEAFLWAERLNLTRDTMQAFEDGTDDAATHAQIKTMKEEYSKANWGI